MRPDLALEGLNLAHRLVVVAPRGGERARVSSEPPTGHPRCTDHEIPPVQLGSR